MYVFASRPELSGAYHAGLGYVCGPWPGLCMWPMAWAMYVAHGLGYVSIIELSGAHHAGLGVEAVGGVAGTLELARPGGGIVWVQGISE